MYEVIMYFTDLKDSNHPYYPGDVFPRSGLEVSEKRFAELSSNGNKQGRPLIVKLSEEDQPKRKGRKPKQ